MSNDDSDVWARLAAQEAALDAQDRQAAEELNQFARRIKAERVHRRWSGEKTARLAGIAHKTYSRIEQGKPVQALSLGAVESLFRSNPVEPDSGTRTSVDALVESVPFLTLAELERVRAAVSVAIAIRSEVTT